MVAAGHYADAPVLSIRLVRWWGRRYRRPADFRGRVPLSRRGREVGPGMDASGPTTDDWATCQPLGLVSFPQFG
jgi:hypothetical protein